MVTLDPAIAMMLLAPLPFELFRNITDLRVVVASGPTTSGASTLSNSHCSTAKLEKTTVALFLCTYVRALRHRSSNDDDGLT